MNDLSHDPLCSPFHFEGSRKQGLLLIHGFTATPGTLFPLGKSLSEQTGCLVQGILLPGHGRTPEDMRKTGWQDWLSAAQDAFDAMQAQCDTVSVAGLSMGGVLTLLLCETRPVAKALPIAAALNLQDRRSRFAFLGWPFVPYIQGNSLQPDGNFLREYNRSYDQTPVRCVANLVALSRRAKRGLKKITCPLLVVRSGLDEAVLPTSADLIMSRTSSKEKRLLELKESSHVCTLGPEREILFREAAGFLKN